jgi:hypothetical protein
MESPKVNGSVCNGDRAQAPTSGATETLEAAVEAPFWKGRFPSKIAKSGRAPAFTRPDVPERGTLLLVGTAVSAGRAHVSIRSVVARARGLREHHQNAEIGDPTCR